MTGIVAGIAGAGKLISLAIPSIQAGIQLVTVFRGDAVVDDIRKSLDFVFQNGFTGGQGGNAGKQSGTQDGGVEAMDLTLLKWRVASNLDRNLQPLAA